MFGAKRFAPPNSLEFISPVQDVRQLLSTCSLSSSVAVVSLWSIRERRNLGDYFHQVSTEQRRKVFQLFSSGFSACIKVRKEVSTRICCFSVQYLYQEGKNHPEARSRKNDSITGGWMIEERMHRTVKLIQSNCFPDRILLKS